MKRLDNLLEKDLHIVEKRKTFFIIPIAIVAVAVIMMIIFNFTLGSALNLGTDFTGGYSIDVNLGEKLTTSNYDDYCDQIKKAIATVTDENGKSYNIDIDRFQRQGSGRSASIHVKYFAVDGVSNDAMRELVNPAIEQKINDEVLKIIPKIAVDSDKKTITLTYQETLVDADVEEMVEQFIAAVGDLNSNEVAAGLSFENNDIEGAIERGEDSKQLIITYKTINNSKSVRNAIVNAMKKTDVFASRATEGALVSATVSTELIFNAILAVSLALIFMLCYIGLRFQLSSGLACIIALFHDVVMMFAFMAICHIEINSTFIAALITILGYSINNSIIVFDRVRENTKSVYAKNMSAEQIANKSIRETLMRSINTTITTLIMILMVAIIGVADIRIFAFPIIIGLLSGTFSSICIAPSFWAIFQRFGKKSNKKYGLSPKNSGGKIGDSEKSEAQA
ncbi:MAG: protein translocase subunit SecF [Clostridiales bacterium]|nr:protein translocase subunit SecF [Clostridiales bacterium]